MSFCIGKSCIKNFDYHKGRGRRNSKNSIDQAPEQIIRRGAVRVEEIIDERRRPSNGKNNSFILR